MDVLTLIDIIERNWDNFVAFNKNNNITNITTKDGQLSLTEISSNSTSYLSPGNIYSLMN